VADPGISVPPEKNLTVSVKASWSAILNRIALRGLLKFTRRPAPVLGCKKTPETATIWSVLPVTTHTAGPSTPEAAVSESVDAWYVPRMLMPEMPADAR
jgi:hypothetical protein